MKQSVKKAAKLYYPQFTLFQKLYMKTQRVLSFVCALLGIIVLSPVFLVLCIWVVLDSGFPDPFQTGTYSRSREMMGHQYTLQYINSVRCIRTRRKTCRHIC